MPLDLQPVEDLDLQPVTNSAAAPDAPLDLQPVAEQSHGAGSSWADDEPTGLSGVLSGLSQPIIPLHRETPEPGDSALRSTLKALYNVKQGFGEFAESPLGAATAGLSSIPGLGRLVAGGFAADMARNVPQSVQQVRQAYKNGSTQQQIEAGVGLVANAGLGGLLAHEAVAGATPTLEAGEQSTEAKQAAPGRVETTEFAEPLDLQPVSSEASPRQAPEEKVQTASGQLVNTTEEGRPGEASLPVESVASAQQRPTIESAPVARVDAGEIATRPDLMQFKRSDDADAGTNEEDQLGGKWDDLKGGNLLLWEPKNPKAYGLEGDEKYIVANGHHRFEFGEDQDVPAYNAQVVREADGVTAQDARKMAAEINIADGKGTVYDQVRFLRNETGDPQSALQRIGPRGEQAGNIAFNAGKDLYDSFVNEKVTPQAAEAIATAAPSGRPGGASLPNAQNESLQRLGIRKALDGAGPQEISNLIQAVRLEAGHMAPAQLDLFGADDSALTAAETLSKTATRIQGEISREIKATDSAAKSATTARAKGIQFERPPEQILAENAQLKAERSRWDNWALHKDLVAQVRGYAEMARRTGERKSEASAQQRPTEAGRTLDERLKGLKVDTQGKMFDALQGIPVAVWNGAVDVARLALKATGHVGRAIQAAVEHIKGSFPGATEDHLNAARGKLADELGVPMRQYGAKIQGAAGISPDVKSGILEYSYEPKSNEARRQTAQRIIDDLGLDNAIQAFKENDWRGNGAVQSILGDLLLEKMANEERQARASGNTILSHELTGKQIDFADFDLRRSTDAADAFQAMRRYGKMSGPAIVAHARKTLQSAGDAQIRRLKPALDNIRKMATQANGDAVDDFKYDGEVGAAARKAIDADVLKDPEVHKAVVMELAGPWSQSPEILRQARELVRAQANDLLKRKPDPAVPASQRLKVMLDDLSSRAAGIAANHFQGAEPNLTLKQKFVQRLGLTEGRAEILARSMENEFKRQVNAALTKLPKSIATQRARMTSYNPLDARDTAVDREIRRQLKERQVKMGQALKEASSAVDATGKGIVDRVMDNVGFGDTALRDVFNRRWNALVTRQKGLALNRLLKNGDPRTNKTVNAVWQKITKLSNLGAFGDQKYYDAVREGLKLPAWSDEVGREITRRANDLQAKPEGFQRDNAATDLLDYIARQKGAKMTDLPRAMWYANTLSGGTVPLHIGLDNLGSMAGNIMARALRDPGSVPDMLRASGRAAPYALRQAGDILKTGRVPNIKGVVKPSPLLEGNPWRAKHPLLSPLDNWKYVGRVLSAAHLSTFIPLDEMKQRLIARDAAQSEGLTGANLRQRVANIMADGDERVAAARTQATAEGLDGFNARQRVRELIGQQREANYPGMKDWSREFALRATYMNEPYGLIGTVSKALEQGINHYAAEDPMLAHLPRLLAPFIRVPANIINEKLNYTPVGTYRAARAQGWLPWHGGDRLYGQDLEPGSVKAKSEIADLHAKAALGAALTTGVAAIVLRSVHNPNAFLGITGNGPATAQQRQSLRKTGWIPNAFKVGNNYVSYARLPNAYMLSALGNYSDALKYRTLDEMDAGQRAIYALKGAGQMVAQMPYLESMNKVMNAFSGDNESGGKALLKLGAQTTAGFVIPKGLSQIDRLFDPTVYDAKTLAGMLQQQVPFARRTGHPVLNGLGEPVKSGVMDYDYSPVNPDPVWTLFADKQIAPPNVGNVLVGKKGTDDYRALTDDEKYNYTRQTGQAIREAVLERIDELREMDPDTARATVTKIAREVHSKARAEIAP